MTLAQTPASTRHEAARNRFDRQEWAGALGDLGTLAPFVIAYVSVLKLDPAGVLLAFGASMVACGWWYRTPLPVQPMKAVGAVATTQAAQTAVITSGAVYAAGLVTGLIWLVFGATGVTRRLTRWVERPVAQGVVLGLGMGFMLQGARLMADEWLLAGAGLLIVMMLARSPRVPAIFAVLLLGAVWTAVVRPDIYSELARTRPALRWPTWSWPLIHWDELAVGTFFLALPQIPLTLANAVIGVREENNRLFPDRPVTERQIALSTGVMNVLGSAVGGVPMCHGAGGMAAHVAFGARTGGALVILGGLLLVLGVFCSNSVVGLFVLIPQALLGTILFMTGVQLAVGQFDREREGQGTTILLVTAALSMWNVAVGFVVGSVLQRALMRMRNPRNA